MDRLEVINIREHDVCSTLCQRCGACCRIMVTITDADSRFRKFLRTTGAVVLPEAQSGKDDCCDGVHDIQLDLGWCQHLEILEGEGARSFRCRIYNTPQFPELCAQFNCVSWAKVYDCYNNNNELLVTAQKTLDGLRTSQLDSSAGQKPVGANAPDPCEADARHRNARVRRWWGRS